MSRDLLDGVLNFEDHKDDYNKSERKRLRKAFKKMLKKRCKTLSNQFTRSIDELNQL